MKKIIGFYPHIKWIEGAPNIEFNKQEKKRSDLIREYENKHPDEFIWTIGRSAGDTIYAQLRSELKKETPWDRIKYCERKGIIHENFLDDDRVRVITKDGWYHGKHEFDSK